ncbi:hypothetical protein B0H11DRAFT_2245033 [Mycena galericulata]|nr:hypothetical protein B0H11DRAFT_2245033 [Mycena galericulata]
MLLEPEASFRILGVLDVVKKQRSRECWRWKMLEWCTHEDAARAPIVGVPCSVTTSMTLYAAAYFGWLVLPLSTPAHVHLLPQLTSIMTTPRSARMRLNDGRRSHNMHPLGLGGARVRCLPTRTSATSDSPPAHQASHPAGQMKRARGFSLSYMTLFWAQNYARTPSLAYSTSRARKASPPALTRSTNYTLAEGLVPCFLPGHTSSRTSTTASAPKMTDGTMRRGVHEVLGKALRLQDLRGDARFTISHFNGLVTYSVEGFLACNLDMLNPGLFSGKAIATTVHPRNEDTIVAMHQPVKPMRAPLMRWKNTPKRGMPLSPGSAGGAILEDDIGGGTEEARWAWHVFCMNPNDVQLPNQRSVKGQVCSTGLAAAARRSAAAFEVRMAAGNFVSAGADRAGADGVWDGGAGYLAGCSQVQKTFHCIEDKLRAADTEEQKRHRMRDAKGVSPWAGGGGDYGEPFDDSSAALPLVAHASLFQRAELYEREDDGYDVLKALHNADSDFDARGRR